MKGLQMDTMESTWEKFQKQLQNEEEIYCCENAQMPKGMKAGYGLFGGYVASCENCKYVCAYWDCACELAHDCKENN